MPGMLALDVCLKDTSKFVTGELSIKFLLCGGVYLESRF